MCASWTTSDMVLDAVEGHDADDSLVPIFLSKAQLLINKLNCRMFHLHDLCQLLIQDGFEAFWQ